MPIYSGSNKISALNYGNTSVAEAYYGDVLVFRKTEPSEFYMRLYNTTGSTVTVNSLNNLLMYKTGNPVLRTAVVERSGGDENIKGTGNLINTFTVENNESCVFRMTWTGGLFSLQGSAYNSYSGIVRSAGCKLNGNYNIPDYFMYFLFCNCVNYNQQAEDVFDTTELTPSVIGIAFLSSTWNGCTSLVNSISLDTSNWNITTFGRNFMDGTWNGCTSLVDVIMFDTSNWNITSIPEIFLRTTWNGCTSLVNAIAFDTSNWYITRIDNAFLSSTWNGCTSLVDVVMFDTSNWNIANFPGNFFVNTFYNAFTPRGGGVLTLKGDLYATKTLTTISMGIDNARAKNIKVDPTLITTYQNSTSWSNITDSKFISW